MGKIERFHSLSCEHESGERFWECKLDELKRELDEINLKGDRNIELFPFEGNTALHTTDTYCLMTKGRIRPILYCNTNKEQLTKDLSWMRPERIEEW